MSREKSAPDNREIIRRIQMSTAKSEMFIIIDYYASLSLDRQFNCFSPIYWRGPGGATTYTQYLRATATTECSAQIFGRTAKKIDLITLSMDDDDDDDKHSIIFAVFYSCFLCGWAALSANP